jgi:hypothetical protein
MITILSKYMLRSLKMLENKEIKRKIKYERLNFIFLLINYLIFFIDKPFQSSKKERC